jgi:hypothetical protein
MFPSALEGSRFGAHQETSPVCFRVPSGQRISKLAAPGNNPARLHLPRASGALTPGPQSCESMGRSREPPVLHISAQDVWSPSARRGAALERTKGPPVFVSVLHPARGCRNGRLPGSTQRDVFTHGFRFVCTRTTELRIDGSFPGAACFRPLRPN